MTLPLSLSESRDSDPYPLYEEMRRHGDVVRDEGMVAWLVLDHAGCTFVERREDLFEEPTGSLPGAAEITGRRDLRALTGDAHDVLHGALSHAWRPQPIAPYGPAIMRPVIEERISVLVRRERFELFEDFAAIVPIRIIARILGLPDEDEATLRRAKAWLEAVLHWRHTYGGNAEARAAAVEATAHISPMLLDVIRRRRDDPGDDVVSLLWSAGRRIAPDWDESDVLANATFLFEAGSETTSLLICSLVKRLLEETPERRATVLADDVGLRWYIEEVLRHTTVVHWRARRATRSVQLGEVSIAAGDMVHPVNAAANRDPLRWERPASFDPARPRLAGHLAFNIGPRHCAGAHLARLQVTEMARALFRAFPDLAIDATAPAPRLTGYVSRAWQPLHISRRIR